MTASVVMPSASPSKLRMIRWRSAGRATARMSSVETLNRPSSSGVDLAGGHERLGAARRAAVADVLADEARGARLSGASRRAG